MLTRDKIYHWSCVIVISILPFLIWYTPNFVSWRIGIALGDNQSVLIIWARFMALQYAFSAIIGYFYSIKRGPDGVITFSSSFGRAFVLALIGGLITALCIHPKSGVELSFWFRLILPITLAIFGGIQISLVGLMVTTVLFEPSREKV